VVLANFNHLQKLGPGTFKLWTQILINNPNASLWLLKFPSEAEAHLKKAAEADGVDARRVILTDKFPFEEHLRVKRAASMLLDTLEYNAHVSGLDALWAGLPLVSLAGL
jgi:predicted O-linked N-acetylglucosamine transferase (SPINDLY family)